MHVVMEQAPPIKAPTRGAAAVAEVLDFMSVVSATHLNLRTISNDRFDATAV